MRRCVISTAFLAFAACGGASLRASVIASDGFESYTSGSTVSGQNGGTGFSAGYVSDNSNAVKAAIESLTYSSGALSSNGGTQDLQVGAATTGSTTNVGTGIDSGTLGRTFSAQTGTVYFSFLLHTSASATANNEFFEVGLSNSTGSVRALGRCFGATASAFDFFARTNGAGTTSTTLLSPSTSYLIVGKVSVTGADGANYDRVDLYVDPSTTTEPGTPTVTRIGNSTLSTVSTFDIRTARFSTGDVYSVDNVLIGTTYADVVTPEPASIGLLGLASIALLRRRRRSI